VFTDPQNQSQPQHNFYHEPEQYRLKVQRYTSAPPELTIQRISFERDAQRYGSAYESGFTNAFPSRGGRSAEKKSVSAESLERSERRAKTNCRKSIMELAPSSMVTFTTREVMAFDALLGCWKSFQRLCRDAGVDFQYVAVVEPHPTNPEHLHLHVAYRGRIHYDTMRRLWHIALEARHGRRVKKTLYGSESPGNITDSKKVKARDPLSRMRKIAKYVSKYITKDMISQFNRKRYWPSKGISVKESQIYWLKSLSQVDAIREGCGMLGQWDDILDVCPQKVFSPSDRVAWIAVDPSKTPDPPF
jgi:hypothetical protein